MPHVARPRHDRHVPKLVTLRAVAALRCLRSDRVFPELRRRLAQSSRDDFRVVQFSVQRDHVHLIAEADGHAAFERGMRGLCTRLAIGANRRLSRRGKVWADRFHARALPTPKAVRIALVYVLGNARKHLGGGAPLVDPRSSAPWFDGFRETDVGSARSDEWSGVVPSQTWLLRLGWRRHGLISVREGPRGRPQAVEVEALRVSAGIHP